MFTALLFPAPPMHSNIAVIPSGASSLASSGAARALVEVSVLPSVRSCSKAIVELARALSNILSKSPAGRAACLEARTSVALVHLASCPATVQSARAAKFIATGLGNAAVDAPGLSDCIAAGGPAALARLMMAPSVLEDSDAAGFFGAAISNMATSAPGLDACVAAQIPKALVSLAATALGDATASMYLAAAMGKVAIGAKGHAALMTAGAPAALVALAKSEAVWHRADAARNVSLALSAIAMKSIASADACRAAGAIEALEALGEAPAVRASSEAREMVAHAIFICVIKEEGTVSPSEKRQ